QQKLRNELHKLGFKSLESDHCIYTTTDGYKGIIIATYVDDFLITGPKMSEIKRLKQKLNQAFDMKDLGEASHFLGVRIVRKRKERTLQLVQDNYNRKFCKAFGLDKAAPVYTPMDTSTLNSMKPNVGQATAAEIKQYQKGTGSLMYAMTQTRPDLNF